MRDLTARLLVLLASAAILSGCTEDTLAGIDPDGAPGSAAETIEVDLSSTELPLWLDTTFTGYAVPSAAGILLVAEDSLIRSRILARFPTIPDSLSIEEDRFAAEIFSSASLRIVVDSSASVIPAGGLDVDVFALARGFDDRDASWTEAATGEPWATPGGDFAQLLGTLHIDSVRGDSLGAGIDTLFVPFSAPSDSVLKSWRSSGGEPGIAVVTQTAGATLTLNQISLRFDVKPEGQDTLVQTLRSPTPTTFIFDPETPPPTAVLRLGGLPAARTYIRFVLPDSVEGVALRGSRINRATLILTSLGTPDAPFATKDTLLASVFSLLADPFSFGPKTPVGANFGQPIAIVPENQVAGAEQLVNLTSFIQSWSTADPDSVPDLRVGIRVLPEGGGLGFWEFGETEDPARAPRIRIILTPQTQFELP